MNTSTDLVIEGGVTIAIKLGDGYPFCCGRCSYFVARSNEANGANIFCNRFKKQLKNPATGIYRRCQECLDAKIIKRGEQPK